jgi:hypothetical protein
MREPDPKKNQRGRGDCRNREGALHCHTRTITHRGSEQGERSAISGKSVESTQLVLNTVCAWTTGKEQTMDEKLPSGEHPEVEDEEKRDPAETEANEAADEIPASAFVRTAP